VQPAETKRLQDLASPAPSMMELAEAVPCSYSLIIKVSRGERKPNSAIRAAVERLYGFPASLVFGDEVARPRRKPGGSDG
jgi:hypothetical protein